MENNNNQFNQKEYIVKLAYSRGARGITFATIDEYQTPGYSEAWQKGWQEYINALKSDRIRM